MKCTSHLQKNWYWYQYERTKERLCLFERLRREPTPFGPQTMGWDSQFTSNAKVVRFLSCRERYLFLCARVAALS